MASLSHRQRIEKAKRIIFEIPASLTEKRQPGMRPQDQDEAVAKLNRIMADMTAVIQIYTDAERRRDLMREHPRSGSHG